jgi:esterase/lipase superfamily enzyme
MSIRIYFATNRNPIPNAENPSSFGHDFAPGLDDLRFGQVLVDDTNPDKNKWGISDLACLPNIPTEGSKAMLKELKTKMFDQKRPTFVFIHGYNTNWENACKAAASLKRAYASLNPNVVLVSWPSDGIMGPRDIKEYGYDRHDAQVSGRAIYRGLMKLRQFLIEDADPACGQKMVLFAHSMGNFALSNAIKALIDDTPAGKSLPRLFDHIISAAADEDNTAFVKDRGDKGPGPWVRIGELCGSMTIYFNKNDTALFGSQFTKGNPDRMGNHGPSMPFDIPGNVTVVDVSKLDPFLDFVGHGYFDTWPRVITDITAVVNDVDPESIPGRNYIPAKNKFCIG